MKTYPGTRVHFEDAISLREGEYGKDPKSGVWYCRPVGEHLGNLRGHQVEEHEDGTITVRPSILLMDCEGNHLWHGFLTRGEWREC